MKLKFFIILLITAILISYLKAQQLTHYNILNATSWTINNTSDTLISIEYDNNTNRYYLIKRSLRDDIIVNKCIYPYVTKQRIYTMSVSPDGNYIAIDEKESLSHRYTKTIHIFNIKSGICIKNIYNVQQLIKLHDNPDDPEAQVHLSFNKTNNILYISKDNITVFEYNLHTDHIKQLFMYMHVNIYYPYVSKLNSPVFNESYIEGGNVNNDMNKLFYLNDKHQRIYIKESYLNTLTPDWHDNGTTIQDNNYWSNHDINSYIKQELIDKYYVKEYNIKHPMKVYVLGDNMYYMIYLNTNHQRIGLIYTINTNISKQ